MLRASLMVFIGYAGGTLLSFARNAIIGRAVSVEDFGIVGTFAMAFAIIEMATYAGLDRLIVQAKDGESEELQANLQAIQILRGLVGAAIFFALAWPYAWILGNQDIVLSYLLVCVLPLLRCFIHFDAYRLQRKMSFGPTMLVTISGPAVSLVVVAILLFWIDDYRIMLIALVVHQGVFVAMTHVVARRRWRAVWSYDQTIRALKFGLPLLLNGVLIFAIHNGDLLLVGSFMGMEQLGWFYVPILITLSMSMTLDTTIRTVMLPGLSASGSDPGKFQAQVRRTIEYSIASSVSVLFLTFALGPGFILLAFGSKYSPSLEFLGPLSVLFAIKTAKSAPFVISMARAKTLFPAIANFPRFLSLVALAGVLSWGTQGGIELIIYVAIAAELVSLLLAYSLTISVGYVRLSELALPMAVLSLAIGATVVGEALRPSMALTAADLDLLRLLIGTGIGLFLLLLPAVREIIRRRISAFLV